jgi:hypothetical protein
MQNVAEHAHNCTKRMLMQHLLKFSALTQHVLFSFLNLELQALGILLAELGTKP